MCGVGGGNTTKMIIGSCFLAQEMIDMLINGSIYWGLEDNYIEEVRVM